MSLTDNTLNQEEISKIDQILGISDEPDKSLPIKSIGIEQSALEHPQAFNIMVYFDKILFRHFPEKLKGKVWVAGGIIRDYLEGKYLETDIDVFSISRTEAARLTYFLRKEFEFKPYLITKTAIKGEITLKGKRVKLDIVKRVFDNQELCISNFDFTVCGFSTDGNSFCWIESAPFDLLRKKLVINKLAYPIDSLKRLQRYIKKGFSACNGTLLTLAKEISKVDSNNEDIFDFYKFD